RFEFHDVTPAADLFGGFLGLADERFAGLAAVTADVHHYLGAGLVLLEQEAVRDVLEVGKGLALAADEAARVVRFEFEEQAVVQRVFFHRRAEAERLQDFFEDGFGCGRHKSWWNGYFFFFWADVNTGEAAGTGAGAVFRISFACNALSSVLMVI